MQRSRGDIGRAQPLILRGNVTGNERPLFETTV